MAGARRGRRWRVGLGLGLAAAGLAAAFALDPWDRGLGRLREGLRPGQDLAAVVASGLARFLAERRDANAHAVRREPASGCRAPEALAAWAAAPGAGLRLRQEPGGFALAFETGCGDAGCEGTLAEERGLTEGALVARLAALGCVVAAGLELRIATSRRSFRVRFDRWGCVGAVSETAAPSAPPAWPAPPRRAARCPLDPERYRLTASGSHWDVVGGDAVVSDLLPRYADFFAVVLDPEAPEEANLRPLRDDLERAPTDRRNFDALNAVAIGYFELNYRAQSDLGGRHYLSDSFRAAKLLAVPWRAYGEVAEPRLRDAILDFFEDAATGDKLAARETAGRIERIVASLEPKEDDPARRARIQRLLRTLGRRE
jgi:hypothetical protein